MSRWHKDDVMKTYPFGSLYLYIHKETHPLGGQGRESNPLGKTKSNHSSSSLFLFSPRRPREIWASTQFGSLSCCLTTSLGVDTLEGSYTLILVPESEARTVGSRFEYFGLLIRSKVRFEPIWFCCLNLVRSFARVAWFSIKISVLKFMGWISYFWLASSEIMYLCVFGISRHNLHLFGISSISQYVLIVWRRTSTFRKDNFKIYNFDEEQKN